MKIQLSGYFSGFSSKVDKSASLRFTTQELSSDDYKALSDSQGEFGWILFAPNSNTPPEAPDEAPEEEGKSLSERLRNTLFVYWKKLEKEKKTDKDFESYRRMIMESYIENIKSKLD